MSDEELESLRQRKLLELQQRLSAEQQQIQAQEQLEIQKQSLLRRILTPDARQRLANLKIVKPNFGKQLEMQLIQLVQQRRLNIPINDDQLKKILIGLQSGRREIKIRRI
jgi:programmed cell death protein 5